VKSHAYQKAEIQSDHIYIIKDSHNQQKFIFLPITKNPIKRWGFVKTKFVKIY